MAKISFNRSDIYRKVIKINGVTYKHFNLLDIPKNFGCIVTNDGKDGINKFINFKGLTYYAEQ